MDFYFPLLPGTKPLCTPRKVEFLLTYYMPLLPLWSGIILGTVNSESNVTDRNAIVENWFRIVKYSIFILRTGIQAADFIEQFKRILKIELQYLSLRYPTGP